jgi:hypothetical protein
VIYLKVLTGNPNALNLNKKIAANIRGEKNAHHRLKSQKKST